ncbi:MAG: SOS response-associated peptidase [Sneathiella sp.]|nr:SOS response-associated peptidase [Sneathiella sp.]
MCARFSLTSPIEALRNLFQLSDSPNLRPSYNIAPTNPVFALRLPSNSNDQMQYFTPQWGLIPSWSKEKSGSSKLINARSETVSEKPSFRTAFKKQRCLIPANGFFEWQKTEDGSKQPYFIQANDQSVFSFAGLWETWTDQNGEQIESCTILTQTADEIFATLHNRMPVTINPDHHMTWLAGSDTSSLPRPDQQASFFYYPVHKKVGNVRENDADLIIQVKIPDIPIQGSLF